MNNEFKGVGTPASDGMFSFDIFQGYPDTCGIRSQQIILRDFGRNILQEDLIAEAKERDWYGDGTPISAIGNILELHGIGVSRYENASVDDLMNALAQGRRVIVCVDSDELWGEKSLDSSLDDLTPNHALIVAGIDTSDADNPKVILTDPGTGDVAKSYPLDDFRAAWNDSKNMMVVTNDPVPNLDNFDYDKGCITSPIEGSMSYEEWHHAHADVLSTPCMVGLDTDNNGEVDTWLHDIDRNGTLELASTDITGDGTPDIFFPSEVLDQNPSEDSVGELTGDGNDSGMESLLP